MHADQLADNDSDHTMTTTADPTPAPAIAAAAAATADSTRRDGRAYIDETAAAENDDEDDELVAAVVAAETAEAVGDQDGEDDGSSVEEESDVENENEPWPELEGEGGDGVEYEEGSDGEMEWGVEDEDWELADGDFTKQYNRARQSYAATSAPSTASGSKPLPLPSRNAPPPRTHRAAPPKAGTTGKKLVNPTVLLGTGVAANPKASAGLNQKDKADRATHEQVLDARTRLVLSALVNRGYFGVIDGCVSTGKEANVYLAYAGANPPATSFPYPPEVAVKIYRTSILNFRSRANYIVGEFRFQGGYAKAKNPRKMVRLWAEKELRNLRRLVQGGIRAPNVIEQRENVLVMELLGSGSSASPRLKDADISKSKLPRLYGELLVAMRRMYNQCKLVHADLSEYNILYHQSHLYIIDVSQSVEHDHPSAFDFLRSDIRNVEDFFTKRSGGEVRTLGLRRAWSFIVDESVGLAREDELGDAGEERLLDVLRTWLDRSQDNPEAAPSASASTEADAKPNPPSDAELAADAAAAKAQSEVDDAVFFSSYIPRSLGEVYDPERDVELLKSGQGDTLIYAGITGLHIHDKEVGGADAEEEGGQTTEPEAPAPTELDPENTAQAEDDDAQPPAPPKRRKSVRFEDEVTPDEDEDEDEEAEFVERKPRGFRHMDKESKKERKKALKEETREKRKNKMPKAEKQRLIKKSSGSR